MTDKRISIHSTQHPYIKHLVKLQTKKRYRDEWNQIVILGKKLIKQYHQRIGIKQLLLRQETVFSLDGVETAYCSEEAFKKICFYQTPDGVAAVIEKPNFKESLFHCALYCDRVQDPGNMGSIIRSAKAFGADLLYHSADSADPLSPKVISASKGYSLALPSFELTQEALLQKAKDLNIHLYAADQQGQVLRKMIFHYPCILILGNEGQGIAPLLKAQSEHVAIPMNGEVESLNVAIAGAIVLYQMRHAL